MTTATVPSRPCLVAWADIVWTDILGRAHVVRCRVPEGSTLPDAVDIPVIDAANVVVGHDGTPLSSSRPLRLVPDESTVFPSPWEPSVVVVMADLVELDGSISAVCSRSALAVVLSQAADEGFTVQTAAELEFFLIDPETGGPLYHEISQYSMVRGTQLESVMRPIRIALEPLDIPIEAMNPEFSGGQVEVNLRYGPALRSADRATLLRVLVRRLAAAAGMQATFMAKPWSDKAGSGLHIHQSLWHGDHNVMADGAQLSEVGRQYVAGLVAHTAKLALLGSGTPNAYHRRADFSFAPTVVTWGSDNRTLSTRVVEAGPTATRVEQRDASADANIYLVMAGQIAAGLDGIRRQLHPPAPSVGNAYTDRSLPRLPRTFVEAFELFTSSPDVGRLLTTGAAAAYVAALEPELDLAITAASDWERLRYLGAV